MNPRLGSLTKRSNIAVIIIWKQEVPNFLPLNLGRGTTGPFPAQELVASRPIDTGFRVMVRNVAHEVFRLPLMITQFLSRLEVAVAPITYKGRWVVAFVLPDNMLP